ncbi:hypothetical protein MAPG_05196 [Magnaporthiopsis poae ATCC 64411]|uniref:Uncharacterized protein n=1 Tax=Magnaporthiopsis poae (strain ATCC 64411 / 73-15) TaxID=644358 RepID=A0A0C4DYS0_MAGP6|nr:hypothetical protein MAPG_05196 [Magnaporthiopsis poae ATCC 64411]
MGWGTAGSRRWEEGQLLWAGILVGASSRARGLGGTRVVAQRTARVENYWTVAREATPAQQSKDHFVMW